ncbi:MAG: hypothetical protein AUG85_08235 [Gemmatimonadetes bacterium 13_1_20CM_4_66_11]|nr:MAG: hypothetical protein AUI86_11750 [Gemmatimonadetes bacterium 13_1_40CM_3_66_12]OLD87067.1 MAG: hypothetical protein AUG85_08235 [Gemmatimonadetes bacterium 13_1_20CM_4_66_11]
MRRRRYRRRRNPPLTKTLTSWPFLLLAAGGLWLYFNRRQMYAPGAVVPPSATGQTFQLPGGGTARLPAGMSAQAAALIQAAARAASSAWPTNWPTTTGNGGTIYEPSGGYDPTVWGGDTTDWGGGIDTGAADITLSNVSMTPVYEAP